MLIIGLIGFLSSLVSTLNAYYQITDTRNQITYLENYYANLHPNWNQTTADMYVFNHYFSSLFLPNLVAEQSYTQGVWFMVLSGAILATSIALFGVRLLFIRTKRRNGQV